MKKTIVFLIIIILLIAACLYYNCMQREKFEQERNEAVALAVQNAIDSMNQHAALEAPRPTVAMHTPPPPSPPKEEVKKQEPEKIAEPDVFIDPRDGQQYKIFEANGLWWMGQNLNFATPGSWCYALEDEKCTDFGRLYPWPEAMAACPEGWHLPNDEEWRSLIDYYGGVHYAGKELKQGGASGFNAVFSGYRDKAGFFGKINESAYFWSSTTQNDEYASFKGIYNSVDNVGTYTYPKKDGFSVRCVKNN